MDVLIVEPLDSEVWHWLGARHAVHMAPELAHDAAGFRRALAQTRALITPPSVALDAATLRRAPQLRIVGRLSAGAENIDIDACAQAGIEVVRPASASATAEAEFAIAAVLQMLRRVPILSADGLLVGRELHGATVGIAGLTPSAKPLAVLLAAFGARVVGYDPGLHASDPLWQRAGVQPVSLRTLMRDSDALCVLLTYFPRFAGLFGERVLADCKPDQVIVSLTHSKLFDDAALARAMTQGPLAAVWLDSLEPGALDPGQPLRHVDTLQVTPRIGSTTQQSRTRSAWAVARRIDELLLTSLARTADTSAPALRRMPAEPAPVSARPAEPPGLAGAPAPA